MTNFETGKVSVETENIFPIIKKWLYSEKDIFFRELVSNASDAITKLKKIALTESFEGGTDYRIDIQFDQTARTLTISDNGIGMSQEEVKKYINQIAFSGATDFAKRFQSENPGAEIIGHFGLGFYSSFMVSKKVTIETKSYRSGETAVKWESESGIEFSLSASEKTSRGTTITLELDSDSGEYLDKYKLKDLVKKYCDFLPVAIFVDGEEANKKRPLWSETPSSLKKEDYDQFYNYLFPFAGESLFHIHLNVDYPFRLQGILFFPKITHEMDVAKNGIKLYCNHVFVSEDANELIPQFLTILKGTIDIPDLPLNVSRSYLQNDPLVKKISSHITKKVADRLLEDFKKDRKAFEENWQYISLFVKYGFLTDEKFYESAKDILLFKTSSGVMTTLSEYNLKNAELNDKKVYYANDTESSSVYMDLLKSQGMEAILVDSKIDSHLVQFLETKNPESKFQRVDSELSETLVDKSASSGIVDSENKTEKDRILEFFQTALKRDGLEIKIESLKASDVPSVILLPEYIRRMIEMNTQLGKEATDSLLKNHTLILNANSGLVKNAFKFANGLNPERGKKLAEQVYDFALLSAKIMSPNESGEFLKRSVVLLEELTNS